MPTSPRRESYTFCTRLRRMWALEKNEKALAFYGRHGFFPNGVWQYEEGTVERLLLLERQTIMEG